MPKLMFLKKRKLRVWIAAFTLLSGHPESGVALSLVALGMEVVANRQILRKKGKEILKVSALRRSDLSDELVSPHVSGGS